MKYMVVIEQGPTSFGAYVPDLPGCAFKYGSSRIFWIQDNTLPHDAEGSNE